MREIFDWLAARPEIDRSHIGAWGISLGGGAVLRSLVQGVPWAAVETVETWTDLYSALIPQGLAKSGALLQFLTSVPENRLDPSVLAIRNDALASTNLAALHAWADVRSSRPLLAKVKTPVFMFQGRRDFAFDITQAKAGYRAAERPEAPLRRRLRARALALPRPRLRAGRLARPALVHALPDRDADVGFAPVSLAPSPWRGKMRAFATLPATRRLTVSLLGGTDSAHRDRPGPAHERPAWPRASRLFGPPQVKLTARLTRRLVAGRRGADGEAARGSRRSCSARAASTRPGSPASAS